MEPDTFAGLDPARFSGLDISRYRLVLRAAEPASLPVFLGSTLRGGFRHIPAELARACRHAASDGYSRLPRATRNVFSRILAGGYTK